VLTRGGHDDNLSYTAGESRRVASLNPEWAKLLRLYFEKKMQNQNGWGSAQVVMCLLSRNEALGPIPGTSKKKI
jgi:hypothetical protein